MSQSGIALLGILFLSIIFKDYILAAAAGVLFLLNLIFDKGALVSLSRPAFLLGIFFLMVFIMMPVATEKVRLSSLMEQFKNPIFFLTIATAAIISYFGGRGISFMQQPHILFAVVLGTLIGVLFLRGLPAGLIIAAGIVSVVAGIMGK